MVGNFLFVIEAALLISYITAETQCYCFTITSCRNKTDGQNLYFVVSKFADKCVLSVSRIGFHQHSLAVPKFSKQ